MNLTHAFVKLWRIRDSAVQVIGADKSNASLIDYVLLFIASILCIFATTKALLSMIKISGHIFTAAIFAVLSAILFLWTMFIFERLDVKALPLEHIRVP